MKKTIMILFTIGIFLMVMSTSTAQPYVNGKKINEVKPEIIEVASVADSIKFWVVVTAILIFAEFPTAFKLVVIASVVGTGYFLDKLSEGCKLDFDLIMEVITYGFSWPFLLAFKIAKNRGWEVDFPILKKLGGV